MYQRAETITGLRCECRRATKDVVSPGAASCIHFEVLWKRAMASHGSIARELSRLPVESVEAVRFLISQNSILKCGNECRYRMVSFISNFIFLDFCEGPPKQYVCFRILADRSF